MSVLALLFLLPLQATAPPKPVPIEIELKKGSPEEVRTRDQLQRLLREHDAERWIFTRKVVIDGTPNLIPHSHPVLTLNTEYLKDDDLLLSTFVHEQLHWYLEENHERAKQAMEELRKLYPDAPSGPPWGARDLESTYRHLIVCYWETRAARELLGELRGFQVAQYLANDHYMWVYRKVQQEGYKVGPIIHKHGLIPDARKGLKAASADGSSTGSGAASDR